MFKQVRKLLKVLCVFLAACLAYSAHAQTVTLRGKITDSANNAAVSGASITEKENPNNGTLSDANGNFKITVPKGSVVVVSSVGYRTTEAVVGNGSVLNIVLASTSSDLNEVVVIGYGTRRKKDLTGAVSTVSSKDIEKSTSMTPELAIQGRTPGVFIQSGGDPQSRPTVRIRGVNTFGYSEPLYVIDGVPIYEGGAGATSGATGDIRSTINIFSLINPDDIESISVLKDASAAAAPIHRRLPCPQA